MFSIPSGFVFRKDFLHTAKIDNELMWLDALGMKSAGCMNKQCRDWGWNERRNHGIWAQDAAPCNEIGTRQTCKLPRGSDYYSWAKRDKEIPNC